MVKCYVCLIYVIRTFMVKDGAYRHNCCDIIPYKHIFSWYFLGFVESGNWI